MVRPAEGQTSQPTTRPAETESAARALYLTGRYAEARDAYEKLASRGERSALACACGRMEVDLALGDYAGAVRRLEALSGAGRADADWHACLAAALAEVGRYEEAVEHNEKAIGLREGHLRARWQLGRLYETLGRRDRAVEAYRPFEERMLGGTLPERADELTWLGRGFLRYSTLVRHDDIVRRTKHVLIEVFQEAFEFVDSAYWPARLAAAELLLEKHNLEDAKEDFARILEGNPGAVEARVGLGRVALEKWDFEAVDRQVEEIARLAPRHVGGRLLLADLRMTERKFAAAAAAAREALETNPRSIEALAVLGAAQVRMGQDTASLETQRRIEEIAPRSAVWHHVFGTWLAAGRQYREAECRFRKAIEADPSWSEPRTALGQLYMETGEEARAREALDAAFALDSFNAQTNNVLELLGSLESFAREEAAHFILKYDRKRDAVVVPYFIRTLESLYDEVCADFNFRPERKTIVEIFPDHLGFSVRITGRPFIATVGAATGPVIALTAPRAEGPLGRFNWATVLRHEFTHTVTLGATANRIPHWMTEGLAVHQEPAPRGWRGKQLLSQAVRRGWLFSLETIDWGFMRPRRPGDRALAYAQSEWMVEYLIERFGFRRIGELLAAFRGGESQAQAFQRVLKVAEKDFDSDFARWAEAHVRRWGLPEQPRASAEELAKKLEKDEPDAAGLAELAQALLIEGEGKKAEAAARQALEQDGEHPRALEAMSGVLVLRMLAEKDEAARMALIEEMEPLARRLIRREPDNPVAMKYLGYAEQAWRQWPEAIGWLTKYQQRYPEDPDSYRRLAGIHLQEGRAAEALKQLESLARLEDDDAAVARQIGALYLDQSKAAQAAVWYRRAIEVDPYDVSAHLGLGEAHLALRAYDPARAEFDAACLLQPDEAPGYDGLARVYQALGDPARAEELAAKARALGGAGDGGAGR